MSISRCALAALAAVITTATAAGAQELRPFNNSWFWGLKGGTLTYSTREQGATTTGTFGGDWLITRMRGGLYVSYDMSNFVGRSSLADPTTELGRRQLEVSDLKRVSAAAVAFPMQLGRFRPYAGIGVNLMMLGDVAVVTDPAADDPPPDNALLEQIDDRQSQSALFFMGGAQAQFARIAVFGQASAVPAASRFLLNRQPIVAVEFGVRYNFGSSIDRVR